MSDTTTAPLAFYRLAPGEYASGVYSIRREATTHGMNRASNPMWFVYHRDERLGRHSTLARAKRHAERDNAEREAAVVVSRDLPVATDGTVMGFDDMVVVTNADWALIAEAVAAARKGTALDKTVEAHLASMTFQQVVQTEQAAHAV